MNDSPQWIWTPSRISKSKEKCKSKVKGFCGGQRKEQMFINILLIIVSICYKTLSNSYQTVYEFKKSVIKKWKPRTSYLITNKGGKLINQQKHCLSNVHLLLIEGIVMAHNNRCFLIYTLHWICWSVVRKHFK